MNVRIPAQIELSPEELNALPERVQRYIAELESRLKENRFELTSTENKLRRAQFASWKQ
jgi:hypothetical protein